MGILLKEATAVLHRPDPGRNLMEGMRRADEIVRDGATSFMRTPSIAVTKGTRIPIYLCALILSPQ